MEPDTKRKKKSDKAKRNFDLTGGKSAKHVRGVEKIQEKNATKGGNGKPSGS